MPHAYQIYDVFTSRPLTGNPLAVVFDADDLDGERMQAIAAEFNLSETVFFSAPSDPAHTAAARIFTPKHELAFAGHPTVGAATALARQGVDAPAIELPAGLVFCRVADGVIAFDAPKLPRVVDGAGEIGAVATALGLAPADVGFGRATVCRVDTGGPTFTMVPVREAARLAAVELDLKGWRGAFGNAFCAAYLVAPDGEARFRSRMFAPFDGIAEDPATGSAAVGLAAMLTAMGDTGEGRHRATILQGVEMGRPSELHIAFEVEGGALARVELSGRAVQVAEGRLSL